MVAVAPKLAVAFLLKLVVSVVMLFMAIVQLPVDEDRFTLSLNVIVPFALLFACMFMVAFVPPDACAPEILE